MSVDVLDAVRSRLGMYVRPESAQYDLVAIAVGAALDTEPATVTVTLLPDGGVRVADDGAGLPVADHKGEHRPWVEVVLTTMLIGRGAPGTVLFVVNALSTAVDVEIARDGYRWTLSCAAQRITAPLTRHEPMTRTGTTLTFRPDPAVLGDVSYAFGTLADLLLDIAAAHPGVRITPVAEHG